MKINGLNKIYKYTENTAHTIPILPDGVRPSGVISDSIFDYNNSILDYSNSNAFGITFPGYPYLAQLSLISEYRSPVETTAQEMCRKWGKIVSTSINDLSEKIYMLENEFIKYDIKGMFRQCAINDGFFGRSQIYIKTKNDDKFRESPLLLSKETFFINDLEGFNVIEPVWTTPYLYNSIDPTRQDFYVPHSWFILGKLTHATRLLTFISRPVPDILKPAYNFGGMSMSQLMEPYVNNWIRTRDSINEMIHSFSVCGVATDMQTTLSDSGDVDNLLKRAELFNKMRDNRGLMITDKNTEEFFQFNTPLTGLSELQAQAQEHMSTPSHTPLVKLTGITPAGLNASSDGEIRVYYDYINASQEILFRKPIQTVLDILQLNLFGEIDKGIGFEFLPLTESTPKEVAEIKQIEIDSSIALISSGVISSQEERERLKTDKSSGYNNLI